jgi:hypothetical protein
MDNLTPLQKFDLQAIEAAIKRAQEYLQNPATGIDATASALAHALELLATFGK